MFLPLLSTTGKSSMVINFEHKSSGLLYKTIIEMFFFFFFFFIKLCLSSRINLYMLQIIMSLLFDE